jgi:hypothetical protein|tara:strand:+ start:258 stop:506 length:249 start_codon:yes stop_codon:yes gene_type:complete
MNGEQRILDLFMDLPKEAENSYLQQHFDKLDKDFAGITKASKTMEILTKSITFMDNIREMEAQDKLQKKLMASGKNKGNNQT